jgi:hypothetical protein
MRNRMKARKGKTIHMRPRTDIRKKLTNKIERDRRIREMEECDIKGG